MPGREPNCPAIPVPGAREGLQAHAYKPCRKSGFSLNSLQLLSRLRTPCYSWSGPACSLSIPDSHFASSPVHPRHTHFPEGSPTLCPRPALNPNNFILVLKSVTRCPHTLTLGPKPLGAHRGSAGRAAPPAVTATAARDTQRATVPTGCGPMHVPLPPGHRRAPGSQERLLKLSFQGGPEGQCHAMLAGESEGRRGGAHAAADRAGGARTREPM